MLDEFWFWDSSTGPRAVDVYMTKLRNKLSHIWDKFYQCDTSQSSDGNGLGLSMVKRVVEIIKGEIDVKSEIGKGSTFVVTIPGCRKA